MQVYIYDIDYLKNGTPNFLAMRISSFHRQQGDYVTLLRAAEKIPKNIECMYVLRRDPELPKPPISLLYNKRVRVYGIEFFENWQPSAALLACRPDYALYPRGRNKFERGDAIQFSDERGHLLPLRQNEINVETNKDAIITDEHFWELSNEDVVKALKSISNRKNIYFLSPIPLSRVLDDKLVTELFLKLSWATSVRLQWINSLPFTDTAIEKVVEFFDKFKASHPTVNVGNIEFYPKTVSFTDKENIMRGLKFIMMMKTRSWAATFAPLHNRLDTVYSHYYALLRNWSIQPHLAFFELIAQTPAKRLGVSIEEYYWHPHWWSDEMFRCGVELYHVANEEGGLPPHWALWKCNDDYMPLSSVNFTDLLRKELWY